MVHARHLLVLSLLAASASASLQPTAVPGHRMQKRLLGPFAPPDTTADDAASSASASSASAAAASSSAAAPASSASAASAASASASAAASASASAASSASAAASQSAEDAIKSASRAAASSASAAAASSASAVSASAAASSVSAASASAASAAASKAASTIIQTSIVSAPTTAASASSTATPENSSGSKTPLIIGVSVVGGVALVALIIFLYVKFGQKRFSDYDDDDADIKWPELKTDPDSAAMVALPARRTGGAGIDMGDEISEHGGDSHSMQEYGAKQRDSFTASNVALNSNGSYGQHSVAPPTVYEDQAGYGMPSQGYYDPYSGYSATQGQGYYPSAAAGGSHYSGGVYAEQAGAAAGYVDPSHGGYVDPSQAAAAHQGQQQGYAAYPQEMAAGVPQQQYPQDPYARGPSPPQAAAAAPQGYGAQPLHNPYA